MSVTLRPVRAGDEGWITAGCQDPEVQRWTTVPRPYTRADAEGFVASGGLGLHTWAIVDSTGEQDRGLGMIGIHGLDEATGDADAGYWVAPWARRRGVASGAVAEMVRLAAQIPGARAVTLQIAATNTASRGVAEKSGFVDTGESGAVCPDGEETAATHLYRLVL